MISKILFIVFVILIYLNAFGQSNDELQGYNNQLVSFSRVAKKYDAKSTIGIFNNSLKLTNVLQDNDTSLSAMYVRENNIAIQKLTLELNDDQMDTSLKIAHLRSYNKNLSKYLTPDPSNPMAATDPLAAYGRKVKITALRRDNNNFKIVNCVDVTCYKILYDTVKIICPPHQTFGCPGQQDWSMMSQGDYEFVYTDPTSSVQNKMSKKVNETIQKGADDVQVIVLKFE